MKNPLLLLSGFLFILLLNACHRPYSLVQRTPSPRFNSPLKSLTTDTLQAQSVTDNQLFIEQPDSANLVELAPEIALASTVLAPAEPAAQSVKHRINRMESLLQQSAKVVSEQPRPKPKSKSQLRLGNRIRDSLGLPLRRELNWWQRIDWKLKSAVFVIGIAVVFAILGLGQLALLFGLIGLLLLVLGLKRSFKARRPWL